MSDLKSSLACAVARYGVPDDLVKKAADRLAGSRLKIRDVCCTPLGICVDHLVTPAELPNLLDLQLDGVRLRKTELFPYGIPKIDMVRIRVEHEIEELTPFLRGER